MKIELLSFTPCQIPQRLDARFSNQEDGHLCGATTIGLDKRVHGRCAVERWWAGAGQDSYLKTSEMFSWVKRRLRKRITGIGELERSSVYFPVEGRMGHEIMGIHLTGKNSDQADGEILELSIKGFRQLSPRLFS